ncbi:MAG: zinc-dependent peptidase [Gammaproteobacteria bacterium]
MSATKFYGFLLIVGLAAVAARLVYNSVRQCRRKQLYQLPMGEEWEQILNQHVSLYRFLPAPLKTKLHGHIHYFLDTKIISGCDGMEVDDVVRLTIAANACILILHREDRIFPGFETILVYPSTYVAVRHHRHGESVTESHAAMAGESWHRGPIVLSWSDVKRGSLNPADGHNVVMHEFAHKLDEETSAVNGMPQLRSHEQFKDWVEVLNREYGEFLKRVDSNRNSVIDEYGSVSPPEFFAVATESFFEKSTSMRRKLPDLYRQLQDYYQLDPASWR